LSDSISGFVPKWFKDQPFDDEDAIHLGVTPPSPVEKVEIGPHTLYLGDCRDVMKSLAPVDAVVTDPPYGLNLGGGEKRQDSTHLGKQAYEGYEDTYENFVSLIVPRINDSLDIARRGVVFSGPHINEQRKPCAIGGVMVPCATGRTPWGSKQFLPMLLYGHPPEKVGCHRPTVLTSTIAAEKNGHPCPKPLPWMKWAIRFATMEGETILDPFMGSGTTGVACAMLGRRFIGIEKERRYFDIACRRIEAALHAEPLLEGCA
jgi:site-specific DNA-methyltransferase (adenine-specific)